MRKTQNPKWRPNFQRKSLYLFVFIEIRCMHVLGDSVGTLTWFLINLMYRDYMYVKSKVFSQGRKVVKHKYCMY